MTNTPASRNQRTFLIVLTLALAAWGSYHALGSYFGGLGSGNLRPDFRRFLVVFGCMAAFLGIWWLLIVTRKPKPTRTNRTPETKD